MMIHCVLRSQKSKVKSQKLKFETLAVIPLQQSTIHFLFLSASSSDLKWKAKSWNSKVRTFWISNSNLVWSAASNKMQALAWRLCWRLSAMEKVPQARRMTICAHRLLANRRFWLDWLIAACLLGLMPWRVHRPVNPKTWNQQCAQTVQTMHWKLQTRCRDWKSNFCKDLEVRTKTCYFNEF